MKDMIKKARIFTVLAGFLVLTGIFSSCYSPSPLYGNWADNNGNKISFISNGSFVATIISYGDKKVVYEGDYTVVDNVIVFSTKDGITVNTEWDIRGSILYLTWTVEGITKNLALYHISK